MPGRQLITHHLSLTTYYSPYLGDARGLGGGEGSSQGRGGDGAHVARVEDVVPDPTRLLSSRHLVVGTWQ